MHTMTATTAEPSLVAVMRKVRAQASKRRLALQPFFADFDRLHTGHITAAQFARVLNSNDMQLSEEELHALVEAFKQPIAAADATATASAQLKENPVVLYSAFLEALQAAPGSIAAVRRSSASATLTEAEEARLTPVRRMLQRAIQAHGTSLVGPFRDLDPLRTGRVTAAQFRRCLPFPSSLSEEAMTLFAKQYSDGRGGVYYMPWCRAMDPSLNEAEAERSTGDAASTMRGTAATAKTTLSGTRDSYFQSTTTGLSRDSFANADLTAQELISIFQQQCALYRIRYEDALRDMDKMRTGRVSAAQFESALGRMPLVHFALLSANAETLARFYGNGHTGSLESCMVDYRSFLRDIHPFHASELSADGQQVPVNFFATTHAADTYITSVADSEKAAALLEKLRANIRANRISLSPVLRDFDRVRKGIHEHRTCTHTRFARGLSTQNILLPPDELQLLIRKYTVPNPDGSPSSEVNYYLFVQDVDPSQVNGGAPTTAKASPQRTGEGTHDTSRGGRGGSAASSEEEAVRHIAQQVIARRLTLGDVLAQADAMRSGTVPRDRLGAVLGLAGVELAATELTALEAAFASTRVLNAVDSAKLQAAVRAMVDTLQRANGVDGGAASRVANTSPEVQRLLQRVRHNVQVHNALLMPFFADFDRNHRGVITPWQFAQAAVRHHLPLSAAELAAVADAYKTDAAHADEVHYLAFIRDVGCGEEAGREASASLGTSATPAAAAGSGGSGGATRTSTLTGTQMMASTAASALSTTAMADIDELLTRLCLFLQERRPRLNEYFPDGDELRHRHVTPTRFRHCLSMLGLTALTEAELRTLEGGFASTKSPGDIDYPAFVCTLQSMLADGVGVAAVTQRRRGSGQSAMASTGVTSSTASEFAQATLTRVQRMLKSRRTATITAFREYDRSRKGFVTDGQFFACLKALGVSLQPDEALALLQLYGVGGGQVHYLPFAQEVDDATLVSVS